MCRKPTLLFVSLIFAIFALSACGATDTAPKIEQPLLEFPGTAWNMTPEEVTAALSIQDTERIDNARELGEKHIVFGVTGREFLGEEAIIMFEFYATYGTHHGLRNVYVIYPASTDTAALTKQLSDMLGEGTAPSSNANLIWSSETPLSEFLPADSDHSYPTNPPATHITLCPHFSEYNSQYAVPSVDFDENGPVIVFCANHLSMLQHESTE